MNRMIGPQMILLISAVARKKSKFTFRYFLYSEIASRKTLFQSLSCGLRTDPVCGSVKVVIMLNPGARSQYSPHWPHGKS